MPKFVPYVYNQANDIKLGDLVYEDLNFNGQYDANEPQLKDIRIELYRGQSASAELVAQTLSNFNGSWSFARYEDVFDKREVVLEPNTFIYITPSTMYMLRFYVPNGMQPTVSGADSRAFIDEKRDAAVRRFVSPDVGMNRFDLDMGFVRSFTIDVLVWLDDDHDGVRDSSNLGLYNITVTIHDLTTDVMAWEISINYFVVEIILLLF